MSPKQPRVTPGVPAGGQFAAEPRTESTVTLTTSAHRDDMTTTRPLTEHELAGPIVRLSLNANAYTPGHFTLDSSRDQFDLNPPYQRGSVWDTTRRQLLIRSLLLGIPTGSIILNDRSGKETEVQFGSGAYYGVIDGKQRIETLRAWADDGFTVPAAWFKADDIDDGVTDGWIVFSQLSLAMRRKWIMRPVSAYTASVKSLAEEAEVYRLVNFGGVEQTADDAARAAAVEGR